MLFLLLPMTSLFFNDKDTIYSDINFGPGWWRYVYELSIYISDASNNLHRYLFLQILWFIYLAIKWEWLYRTCSIYNSDIAVISNGQGACNDSIVLLDLNLDYNTSGTIVITACRSYTWIMELLTFFSNNTSTYTITKPSGCDSVVTLDLTINYSTTGTDVITSCDSYTWIDGNTYTSSNNSATHTLTNAVGCDSVVTLDLTILISTTALLM